MCFFAVSAGDLEVAIVMKAPKKYSDVNILHLKPDGKFRLQSMKGKLSLGSILVFSILGNHASLMCVTAVLARNNISSFNVNK
jgi:hypothetical protein